MRKGFLIFALLACFVLLYFTFIMKGETRNQHSVIIINGKNVKGKIHIDSLTTESNVYTEIDGNGNDIKIIQTRPKR